MADEELIIQALLKELSQTRYACSDITKLNGGTANFLYRGNLLQPLDPQDGAMEPATKTVVVKHSKGFSPGNRDFLLDVSRCVMTPLPHQSPRLVSICSEPLVFYQIYEESMLHGLVNFSWTPAIANTVVRSPRLYLFDHKTNTQVLEDCSNTTDLKTILISPMVKDILPGTSQASVGHDVGSWLRSFHEWTSEPGQAPLRETIGRNKEARNLKRNITCDSFVGILQIYPELVEGNAETLNIIQDAMTAEFELNQPPKGDDGSWGLIHGDFWTGK